MINTNFLASEISFTERVFSSRNILNATELLIVPICWLYEWNYKCKARSSREGETGWFSGENDKDLLWIKRQPTWPCQDNWWNFAAAATSIKHLYAVCLRRRVNISKIIRTGFNLTKRLPFAFGFNESKTFCTGHCFCVISICWICREKALMPLSPNYF